MDDCSKADGRCRGAKFRWTLNRYESLKNACRNVSPEWMMRLNRTWRMKRIRRMERSITRIRKEMRRMRRMKMRGMREMRKMRKTRLRMNRMKLG